MSALINSTVPVLASLNIQDSVDFYTHKLGFTTQYADENYLIISRDGAEIHFWLCSEKHIAENTSCYVRVTDTEALYNEFRQRDVSVRPPQVQFWGVKEMYVLDIHGNLLKFGESV